MAGSLKILMTADTVGGVWTYTVDLCRALQEYNVEVHLMTMGALLRNEQDEQLRNLNNVKLYESNYKLEWMQDCWPDIRLARDWVESVYKKVQPDIIHFNNYGQTAGNWQCPVVTVYHSCVQTWWQAVKGELPPPEWQQYIDTVGNAINASDVIVAPSKGILNQAENVYGKFASSAIIYNGRDVQTTCSGHKEPYLLSAGRIWDEAKNIQLLSNIAKGLKWPVYIAGNNIDPDTGEAPDPENVHFIGQLAPDEMQACMSRASIFVMPAKYEPFGLAVLEAAKAGCALALSNIDTLREIWGDAAVYFDPFDEEDSIMAIQRLIEDESLRKEMAARAVIRAKDFTVEKMAGRYIELYQTLIETTNQQ